MEHIYKTVKVNYELEIAGESLFVFLHGWGSNLNLMKPLSSQFKDKSILLIDFPPFGKSDSEPSSPWSLDDYCNLTSEIISIAKKISKDNGITIKRIVLFGHSFGGRVAIKLAYMADFLVLISSAGLKPRFSFKTKGKVLLYKFYKKIGSKKAGNFGSPDYKILSPIMKQTFNNIIAEDLSKICKHIEAKTLIVSGNLDTETPLYMAKKLRKLIPNSTLVVIEGGDHFVYLKKPRETNLAILNFLLGEDL